MTLLLILFFFTILKPFHSCERVQKKLWGTLRDRQWRNFPKFQNRKNQTAFRTSCHDSQRKNERVVQQEESMTAEHRFQETSKNQKPKKLTNRGKYGKIYS